MPGCARPPSGAGSTSKVWEPWGRLTTSTSSFSHFFAQGRSLPGVTPASAQAWRIAAAGALEVEQQRPGAVTVLDRGRGDEDFEEQPAVVSTAMWRLRPFGLSVWRCPSTPGWLSARSAAARYRLGVDVTPRRWARPRGPRPGGPGRVTRRATAIVTPEAFQRAGSTAVDGAPRRLEVHRQRPDPQRTPLWMDIPEGVHDSAAAVRLGHGRPPQSRQRHGQQWREQRPLIITGIGGGNGASDVPQRRDGAHERTSPRQGRLAPGLPGVTGWCFGTRPVVTRSPPHCSQAPRSPPRPLRSAIPASVWTQRLR